MSKISYSVGHVLLEGNVKTGFRLVTNFVW